MSKIETTGVKDTKMSTTDTKYTTLLKSVGSECSCQYPKNKNDMPPFGIKSLDKTGTFGWTPSPMPEEFKNLNASFFTKYGSNSRFLNSSIDCPVPKTDPAFLTIKSYNDIKKYSEQKFAKWSKWSLALQWRVKQLLIESNISLDFTIKVRGSVAEGLAHGLSDVDIIVLYDIPYGQVNYKHNAHRFFASKTEDTDVIWHYIEYVLLNETYDDEQLLVYSPNETPLTAYRGPTNIVSNYHHHGRFFRLFSPKSNCYIEIMGLSNADYYKHEKEANKLLSKLSSFEKVEYVLKQWETASYFYMCTNPREKLKSAEKYIQGKYWSVLNKNPNTNWFLSWFF